MERRKILQALASIPVLGALVTLMSPLYRMLRPTAEAWDFFRPVDTVDLEEQRVARVSELTQPWATIDFVYRQANVEYSARGQQISTVPGYITRIPDEYVQGEEPEDRYYCLQRICPHLGCTFNFVPEAKDVANAYNYPRAAEAGHPFYACPCHLSVYDPISYGRVDTEEIRGKVVSGPAPRPPRRFYIRVDGDDILVIGMEGGGIA